MNKKAQKWKGRYNLAVEGHSATKHKIKTILDREDCPPELAQWIHLHFFAMESLNTVLKEVYLPAIRQQAEATPWLFMNNS